MNFANSSFGRWMALPQITRIASSNSTNDKIHSLAFDLGFDHVAVTQPDIPSQDQLAYQFWCDQGLAADMEYMTKDQKKRLDVRETYPGVKSEEHTSELQSRV